MAYIFFCYKEHAAAVVTTRTLTTDVLDKARSAHTFHSQQTEHGEPVWRQQQL